MKSILLPLLCLLCTSSTLLEDWRWILDKEKLSELKPPPSATWSLQKGEAVVEVVNPADEPLVYFGYSQSSPQVFREKLLSDKWVEAGYDWCGTGKRAFELPPKGKTEFRFPHDPGKEKLRIYTTFYTKDSNSRSLVMIFSDP